MLSRLAALAVTSWIHHVGTQHQRANVLKLPSAEGARNVAAVCLVTAAILPVVLLYSLMGPFLPLAVV